MHRVPGEQGIVRRRRGVRQRSLSSKVCLAWGAYNSKGNILGVFANGGDYITGDYIRNHTGAVVGGLCRPKLAAVVPDGSSYTLGETATGRRRSV